MSQKKKLEISTNELCNNSDWTYTGDEIDYSFQIKFSDGTEPQAETIIDPEGIESLTVDGTTLKESMMMHVNNYPNNSMFEFGLSSNTTPARISLYVKGGDKHTDFKHFNIRAAIDQEKPLGGFSCLRELSAEAFSKKSTVMAFGVGDKISSIHVINKSAGVYLFTIKDINVVSASIGSSGDLITEEYMFGFKTLEIDTTAKDFYNSLLKGTSYEND